MKGMMYSAIVAVVLATSCCQVTNGLAHHASVSRRDVVSIAASALATTASFLASTDKADAAEAPSSKFVRYPQIRFIAALGDPTASQGTGSETWGEWRDDPGPRGVYLKDYPSQLEKNKGVAPAGWTFDKSDWWLEEHGLIMSQPGPLSRKKYNKDTKEVLPFKKYVVTGAREVTTVLTVFEDGRWELGKGTLYDVTHLPCRSARYTPQNDKATTTTCGPNSADRTNFPVKPGAAMPPVPGCAKQDYAVLFVLGEEA